MNPKKPMLLADTKHKTSVEKGVWEAPSAEEEKIIAPQAKCESLKRQFNDNKNEKNKDDSSDQSGKKKKKFTNKKTPPKPSWMCEEPPLDKLNEPRMWNGKPWHWCSAKTGGKCNGAHRRHKPSQCKGMAGSKRNTAGDSKDKNENEGQQTNPNKRVRIAKALEAITMDDNE